MNCQVVTKVNEVKLKNENYETRNLENSDSDGNIHPDSGTDRNGHYIVHGGLRPDGIVKAEG